MQKKLIFISPNNLQFRSYFLMMFLALLGGCQISQPEIIPTTLPIEISDNLMVIESQPIANGPILLRENISLRKVINIGPGGIKISVHPISGDIFYLKPNEGVFQLVLSDTPSKTQIASVGDITNKGFLTGMKFGPDGFLYVVVNRRTTSTYTQAVIYKGLLNQQQKFDWELLATTDPYPASNTNFDHLFTGITISEDNQWVYVSSGSRTDHGEIQSSNSFFPDVREVPITSAILRFSTNSKDIIIPNDEKSLMDEGYLFADGTRNAYDIEFAPNGDLFAIDNGPDADYPEELNWIREGMHYGFPWRFGTLDNPQQFSDYNPKQDNMLSSDFVAVQMGTYLNDPTFPPSPDDFTDPIVNFGPDAAYYRNANGEEVNVGEVGGSTSTFTPHRSPLGLVFITYPHLPDYFIGESNTLSAFLLSWGAAGGDLSDQGQDLVHLALTKSENNYSAITFQIATEFQNPIDAVMIENRLYVLEYSGDGAIWELTFD